MVGRPTTWGANRQLALLKFSKLCLVVGCNNKLHFVPQKIAAGCSQSRRCGEFLVGLCPPKKSASPPD